MKKYIFIMLALFLVTGCGNSLNSKDDIKEEDYTLTVEQEKN